MRAVRLSVNITPTSISVFMDCDHVLFCKLEDIVRIQRTTGAVMDYQNLINFLYICIYIKHYMTDIVQLSINCFSCVTQYLLKDLYYTSLPI